MKNTDDWRQSHRSIKRRLTGVVLVPSTALVVLWLLVSAVTVYNGFYLRAVAVGVKEVSIPGVDFLASAQHERTLSLRYLAQPNLDRGLLDRQRQHTDRSLAAMRRAADPLLQQSPVDVRERMRALNEAILDLPALRDQVDTQRTNSDQTYAYYNDFMDAGAELFETQARTVPDFVSGQGGLLATQFFVTSDHMARSASLVTRGLSTGRFDSEDHAEYAELVGAYHFSAESTATAVPPQVQERYQRLIGSPAWNRLVDWEKQLVASGTRPTGFTENNLPFTEREWLDTTQEVAVELSGLTVAQAEHASTQALDDGTTKLIASVVGSLLALIAVALAITVALRVARRVAARLDALREETIDLADTRLPLIVDRLRRGESVDVEAELAWLHYGTDEVGQVADAFNDAQQTAVAAAVQESQAREGANNVFLGIAHRSQALVHRQLQLLDRLEHQEEDPDQMEMLFQLDHLATRARRNAENLIILGGEQPGRKWNKPIKLVDIVGSAVAETKHYARVRTDHLPHVSLIGTAVADTIHLIAELVDNATTFSPPHSQVTVQGQTVAKGVAVEVEDHGLGMDEDEREQANAMLADPPEFDAMALRQDTRLGLFVVARLAIKHGIGVELRTSAYGGTRAVVLIPTALIVAAPEPLANGRTTELPVVEANSSERAPALVRIPAQSQDEWRIPEASTKDGPGTSRSLPALSSAAPSDLFKLWDESAKALASDTTAADTPPPDGARHRHREESQPAATGPNSEDITGDPSDEVRWPSAEPPDNDPRPPLPRRRRQASLAPQLRDEVPVTVDDEATPGRSADEVRGLMSAFQQSSKQARAEEDDPNRAEHDPAAEAVHDPKNTGGG